MTEHEAWVRRYLGNGRVRVTLSEPGQPGVLVDRMMEISVKQIRAETGMSKSEAHAAIRLLVEAGLIQVNDRVS